LAFIPQALAQSEMIINYWVIVERYNFSNGVVGGLIHVVTKEKKRKEEN
jgi:hypothetical protein